MATIHNKTHQKKLRSQIQIHHINLAQISII